MHHKKRLGVALAVGFVAASGSFGLAFAQDEAADPPAEQNVEVPVSRQQALSGPEQIAEGTRIRQQGMQISARVIQLLSNARRDRDVIRVTCLNDKLTQINANLRTADDRLEQLRQAVAVQDDARRTHEFTVLTVLRAKFDALEQEANQCIGQDLFDTGPTEVLTEIDDDVPDEDPSVVPLPPEGFPAIPPPLSASL